MRVLDRDPNHAKVLQQLGWLHHQQSTSFSSQEQAIEYLEKSVASGESMQHLSQRLGSLTVPRPNRRAKLVSLGPMLHVATEVSQGL